MLIDLRTCTRQLGALMHSAAAGTLPGEGRGLRSYAASGLVARTDCARNGWDVENVLEPIKRQIHISVSRLNAVL